MGDVRRIFISYSHDDRASVSLLPRLEQHFAFLAPHGIDLWHDGRIKPGTEWKDEIEQAIADARAAILLVGPGFISSDWVKDHELPLLRKAERQKRLEFFPLLVSECAWDHTAIAEIQMLNPKPLGRMRSSAEKDKLLADLARRIADRLRIVTENPDPIVLAVMGVKGGVGKGMFTSCVAQLFAGAGQDVAIVDCDLQDAGTTREAMRRHSRNNISVRTAYQHLAPHARDFHDHQILPNEELWDITPQRLAARNSGRIWLLPARGEGEHVGGFNVVANIDLPREPVLQDVLREMIVRVRDQVPRVRCILIDCGAGTNPLYSAAFEAADYGYILVLPDASYFDGVDAIKEEHRRCYPRGDFLRIAVVGNMVTNAADRDRLATVKAVACVPRNPILQEDQFDHPVDFELGYDDVTAEVYHALDVTFSDSDRKLLPDAAVMNVRPWWNQLVENGIARQVLSSRGLRVRRWSSWIVAVVAVVTVLAVTGLIVTKALHTPATDIDHFGQYVTTLIVAFLALILAAGVLSSLEKKIALLKRIAALGVAGTQAEMTLLHKIIESRDRATMEYLRSLVRPATVGSA